MERRSKALVRGRFRGANPYTFRVRHENALDHRPRIALALSGGGFHASISHLGLLRRLAEFGWLPDIDVICAVSRGSIVAAFAVQRWDSFLQAGGDSRAFEAVILSPFLERIQTHNFLSEWLLTSW